MFIVLNLFEALGGLALFLFGLHTLSSNLKQCFSDRLKRWMEILTKRAYLGAILGALLTFLLQSSSVTMVTTLGLINAGLLNLTQGIGIMLGANVGTTLTVQLVAFEVGMYYFPLIIIGFGIFFFSNKDYLNHLGKVILGFGLLFFGMEVMRSGLAPLENAPLFIQLIENFADQPLLGVLAGTFFTAIVQSSSGTMGLVVAMGLQDMITLPVAISIMFGANIGTCMTAVIASIKSSLSAKRAAVSQITVNVVAVVVFLLILKPFTNLVVLTSPHLGRQIANAHALFNITASLAAIPLVGLLVALVKKIVPGEVLEVEEGVEFINEQLLDTPGIALSQAYRETERMAEISMSMLDLAYNAQSGKGEDNLRVVFKKEETIDEIQAKIESFVTRISPKPLSEIQSQQLALIQHSVGDIERVADHANNIAEFLERKRKENIEFSPEAHEELKEIFAKAKDSYEKAIEALKNDNQETARQVLEMEREVNELEAKFKENHHKRLEKNICSTRADTIYLDMLANLERISDHAENIAEGILMGF